MNPQQYDVIVIGSGMGGLTCASLLARIGKKKVLLLERHSKAGGFTHTFKRELNTNGMSACITWGRCRRVPGPGPFLTLSLRPGEVEPDAGSL